MVLGRVVTPAGRADRVWSIFPERAVEQGVEEDARDGQMDGGEAMPCGSVNRSYTKSSKRNVVILAFLEVERIAEGTVMS